MYNFILEQWRFLSRSVVGLGTACKLLVLLAWVGILKLLSVECTEKNLRLPLVAVKLAPVLVVGRSNISGDKQSYLTQTQYQTQWLVQKKTHFGTFAHVVDWCHLVYKRSNCPLRNWTWTKSHGAWARNFLLSLQSRPIKSFLRIGLSRLIENSHVLSLNQNETNSRNGFLFQGSTQW